MSIQATHSLLDAIFFASEKHRDQRRKDREETPYIHHCIEVAQTLADVGNIEDTALLMAAILHDTIEDTDTTKDELTARFGEDVCTLVLEVTDDKSLAKEERKRLQITNATKKSDRAKALKLGDKICNVRDLTRSPPYKWTLERRENYLHWAKQVIDELRGTHPSLEAYFDEVLKEGYKSIEQERKQSEA